MSVTPQILELGIPNTTINKVLHMHKLQKFEYACIKYPSAFAGVET